MAVKQYHFLLADDDEDDRFFFEKAIATLHPDARVSFATDGDKLMKFLEDNREQLPDVIFLDLNMPRKNGAECLREIKKHPEFGQIAIIIYSTTQYDDIADSLFNDGAHYYIRKPDLPVLIKAVRHVLGMLADKRFDRPERSQFLLKFH